MFGSRELGGKCFKATDKGSLDLLGELCLASVLNFPINHTTTSRWRSPGLTSGLFFHLDCCYLEHLSFHRWWFWWCFICGTALAVGKSHLAHIFFPLKRKFKIGLQTSSSSMIQVRNNMWGWLTLCTNMNFIIIDRGTLQMPQIYKGMDIGRCFLLAKANAVLVMNRLYLKE